MASLTIKDWALQSGDTQDITSAKPERSNVTTQPLLYHVSEGERATQLHLHYPNYGNVSKVPPFHH